MAVLNAGGTSAASSALIWEWLSSDSIFVCASSWGPDLALSFVLLVLAIFDGMFIASQVADVKPKRHHLVMLGINILPLLWLRSSHNRMVSSRLYGGMSATPPLTTSMAPIESLNGTVLPCLQVARSRSVKRHLVSLHHSETIYDGVASHSL